MKYFAPKGTARGARTGERDERRASHRHQLTAAAEVVDLNSGTRMNTRTIDVSQGGCFIDTMLTLPAGSRVRVFLFKSGTNLNADARVTYCQPGLGMGVEFTNLIPEHAPVLDAWLAEVEQQRLCDFAVLPKHAKHEESVDSESSTVRKLIHLLVVRGVLTHQDSIALLHDPII
jgi:hypothetical protein